MTISISNYGVTEFAPALSPCNQVIECVDIGTEADGNSTDRGYGTDRAARRRPWLDRARPCSRSATPNNADRPLVAGQSRYAGPGIDSARDWFLPARAAPGHAPIALWPDRARRDSRVRRCGRSHRLRRHAGYR